MVERPTATELIEAVRQHLVEQVVPVLSEPRLRFRTLVAANVLAIINREVTIGEFQAATTWQRLAELLDHNGVQPDNYRQQVKEIATMNQTLCHGIEQGLFDAPAAWQKLLSHCLQSAREKLAVANPAFLRQEDGSRLE